MSASSMVFVQDSCWGLTSRTEVAKENYSAYGPVLKIPAVAAACVEICV